MSNWHNMDKDSVLRNYGSDGQKGLSTDEISLRQEKYGLNKFNEKKKEGLVVQTLRHLKDVSVIILLVAAVLSLLLAIRDGHGYIEPCVIFAIVIMNLVLAITQERGAERALDALSVLNSPNCYVIRNGMKQQIDTKEVVPGDIIVVRSGDLVPADARLIDVESLTVDESSLTGESEPREKYTDSLKIDNPPLGDQTNMLFSGCLVVGGHGRAVVTSTGMDTQIGIIAAFLQHTKKMKTPLQLRLQKLGKVISVIALASALTLFLIGMTQQQEFWSLILITVTLAVAAVPETLSLIVTLILTQGVKQMVAKNALIRKLQAVETLGSTSIICSDKTGTLTQNRMAIKRLWLYGSDPISDSDAGTGEHAVAHREFIEQFLLASNVIVEQAQGTDAQGKELKIIGDPTESAIMSLSLEKGIDKKVLEKTFEKVAEIPFSSARKMMTTVVKKPGGGYLVLTKGAFDKIPYKRKDHNYQKELDDAHNAFADDALRVITLATKEIDSLPEKEDIESLESELNFQGFIGLIDPPRPEAAASIARARSAGIRTIMITGDHASTAGAIAKELGIIVAKEGVITGQELEKLSDEELFQSIEFYSVYARVSPSDKIRIVQAWQRKGSVVSMTGDGVNDAPALKAADVGVAMGIAGTEVAKSAADMVLIDDNFSSIVSAITEGRNVFSNIRKLIYFLIVCNMSEIVILLFCQIARWGMPVTPVMLLLVNVIGDGIPGMALAQERSDSRIMNRKPIDRNESFFGGGLFEVIITQIIAFSFVTLAGFYIGKFVSIPGALPPSEAIGQTIAFLILGWTSILHILTVRSRQSIFKRGFKDNPQLPLRAGIMIIVFAGLVGIPPIAPIFGFAAISGIHWLIAIGLSIIPTIRAEYGKLWDNYKLDTMEKNRVILQ
ncbi:MAG: cation-translocating P-type ATPase [Treponema sp.]|nr:cation-translocating P-type ATPase [Treponema sp.]